MEVENLSLEQAFEQLEKTIERLESEEITLEDSFVSYKEGMQLLKHCNDQLDKVEKQVLLLSSDGELTEFDKQAE